MGLGRPCERLPREVRVSCPAPPLLEPAAPPPEPPFIVPPAAPPAARPDAPPELAGMVVGAGDTEGVGLDIVPGPAAALRPPAALLPPAAGLLPPGPDGVGVYGPYCR